MLAVNLNVALRGGLPPHYLLPADSDTPLDRRYDFYGTPFHDQRGVIAAGGLIEEAIKQVHNAVVEQFRTSLTQVKQSTVSLLGRVQDNAVSLAQHIHSKMPGIVSPFKNWMKPASIPGCYDNIVSQYPNMDRQSKDIAKAICDNIVTTIKVEQVQLNDDGVRAIAAALPENTALESLEFSHVSCNTEVFADAFLPALQANSHLKSLILRLAHLGVNPLTSFAVQKFAEHFRCLELEELDLGPIDFDSYAADALATAFEQTPHFPLRSFSVTWPDRPSLDAQFSRLIDGLKQHQCPIKFNPAIFTGLSKEMMLKLLLSIGKSQTLESIGPWCQSPYSYNATEWQEILTGMEANLCFLGYTPTGIINCFDADAMAAMDNITQGRTPCTPDPLCGIRFTNCSIPIPPAESSETAIPIVPVAASSAGGVVFVIVVLGVFIVVTRKSGRCCFRVVPAAQVRGAVQASSSSINLMPISRLEAPVAEEGTPPQEGESV